MTFTHKIKSTHAGGARLRAVQNPPHRERQDAFGARTAQGGSSLDGIHAAPHRSRMAVRPRPSPLDKENPLPVIASSGRDHTLIKNGIDMDTHTTPNGVPRRYGGTPHTKDQLIMGSRSPGFRLLYHPSFEYSLIAYVIERPRREKRFHVVTECGEWECTLYDFMTKIEPHSQGISVAPRWEDMMGASRPDTEQMQEVLWMLGDEIAGYARPATAGEVAA